MDLLKNCKRILKTIISTKYLLSPQIFSQTQKKSYQPNKGFLRIWSDYLFDIFKQGCPERGYWMYGFYKMPRGEQKRYIDYESFRKIRNKINFNPKVTFTTGDRYNYLCLLRDKFSFGRFLSSLRFPVAKDILIIDGKSNQLVDISQGPEVIYEPLENLLTYDFDGFCKIVSGECGRGVFKLQCNNGKLTGEVTDLNQLKQIIGESQFLIQERLNQHSALNQIYPHSINTMRLITILGFDGIVRTIPSIVRFGANGNLIDNWAAGGLVVSIDSNGILCGDGYYEFPINNKMTESHHPDTKVKFDGYEIPYYKEAVNMAMNLHKFFYGIPCIGWDIAFTENGPVFIEGNDNFEISLNQAANGGLKKEWEEAISKCR